MEDRQPHFERPTTNRPPSLFNLTIITVIVALLAGFGGALLVRLVASPSQLGYFNFINTPQDFKFSIDQPLTSLALKNQNTVAGVYKEVATISSIGEPVFSAGDFLGSAVVVTSDGWLMTTKQVLNDSKGKIILGDKVYDISQIKTDDFDNLVFIKIEENLLSPASFQLTDELNIGEKLFTHIDLPNSYRNSLGIAFLQNDHYVYDKYLYSDKLDYYLQFDPANKQLNSLGAPYFNLDGYLLGVAYELENQEIVLIPAEYLKQSVKNLLNNTERVKLGLRYVDMENNSGFEKKGNLVFNPQKALDYNLPAYKAGIKVADQILAINNDAISALRSLTSVIQNYRVGDKVIAKVLRAGIEMDIAISL